MKHLAIKEFEKHINNNKQITDKKFKAHIEQCEKCQIEFKEQQEIHNLLLNIHPLTLNKNLFDTIKDRLQPQQIEFFIDTLFVPALILLFIIGLLLISSTITPIAGNNNAINLDNNFNYNLSFQSVNHYFKKQIGNLSKFSTEHLKETFIVSFVMLVFFFYGTLDYFLRKRVL